MRNWRIYIVFLFLFLAGVAIVGRLVFLQVANYGFYKALAQGQQNFSSLVKGNRGTIFIQDKYGTLYALATNQEAFFVFVTPHQVTDKEGTAQRLSDILDVSPEFVAEKLQNEESLHELIKKRISNEEKIRIESQEMPGVYLGKETIRYYPHGALAAHVAGFTNQEGQGQYGIEEYYNDTLEGKETLRKTARNPASYLSLELQDFKDADGSDIILTLDYNIQIQAESLLQEALTNLHIEEGTIIVADVPTGKILALANIPTFNPNTYFLTEDLAIFQNSALQKIYEPGSVFKAITMASAIDAGKISPETSYQDKGIVRIGGHKILNYDERIWGERTMAEVLQFSINTGAVFASQQLGNKRFLEYLERFEIFKPTRVDLAGEVYSKNTEFKKGYEINFATASFGQGIEMTPLQLLKAFSVLANDGEFTEPFLVERFISPDGVFIQVHEEKDATKSIISPKTSSDITAMLVSVIEDGFAKKARIPGYYLAGKTGTAQVSWSALGIQKSGYSDKTVQSFIGYGPAYDPQFLILVKLNNPQTKTAEYSALPIFKKIAKYVIDYCQIPPDYEINPI